MGVCPKCGGDVILKQSRTGSRFLSCSALPRMRLRRALLHRRGMPQVRQGHAGGKELPQGQACSISCDQYPNCDYAVWDWPVAEPCPECHSPILVIKTTRARGRHLACPNPKCRYNQRARRESELIPPSRNATGEAPFKGRFPFSVFQRCETGPGLFQKHEAKNDDGASPTRRPFFVPEAPHEQKTLRHIILPPFGRYFFVPDRHFSPEQTAQKRTHSEHFQHRAHFNSPK